MQESVRKEQKKSQTPLTWPTSLEMLRTGFITGYQPATTLWILNFPELALLARCNLFIFNPRDTGSSRTILS